MATFRKNKKKDGSISYSAIIRITKDGRQVYRESKTFTKDVLARSWARKREVELEDPAELERSMGINKNDSLTLAELIDEYIKVAKPLKSWGATKQNVLLLVQRYPIAEKQAARIVAKDIVDHCVERSKESSPVTANGDYMYIRQVMSVAEDLLGCKVQFEEVSKAQRTLKKIGAIAKSNSRDRRPELQEITDMVELAHRKRHSRYHREGNIPMDKIIIFAMFSSRRLSEITRITRSDTDYERQEVLIRDMKHPGQKDGNDIWVHVPSEAWKVMLSMEQVEGDDRWFPCNARSVSSAFQELRKEAGYHHFFDGGKNDPGDPNLTFHDLRHECLSWLSEKNGLPDENWDVPRLALVSGHQDWNSLKRYVNMRHIRPVNKWNLWEWKERILE